MFLFTRTAANKCAQDKTTVSNTGATAISFASHTYSQPTADTSKAKKTRAETSSVCSVSSIDMCLHPLASRRCAPLLLIVRLRTLQAGASSVLYWLAVVFSDCKRIGAAEHPELLDFLFSNPSCSFSALFLSPVALCTHLSVTTSRSINEPEIRFLFAFP